MKCKCCENETMDNSLFCSQCGKKIPKGKSKFKKKTLIIGATIITAMLITILIVLFNPLNKFKWAIKNGDSSLAYSIYKDKLKGNEKKNEKAISFLKDEVENTFRDFKLEKTTYDKAKKTLEAIREMKIVASEAEANISKLVDLNDSRISFKKGKDYFDDKKYKWALSNLKKVGKEDSNYEKAQEMIEYSMKSYKEETLTESETCVKEGDFNRGIFLIDDSLSLLKEDSDLKAKKELYESEYSDKLEKNQEVSVEEVSTYKQSDDNTYIKIMVKNNSKKVVKKFHVSWMGYDQNKYPVKLGGGSPAFLKKGFADDNIQPGEISGDEGGWKLTESYDKVLKAQHLIACMESVEYTDGTNWTNPYYPFWIKKYNEKPLK